MMWTGPLALCADGPGLETGTPVVARLLPDTAASLESGAGVSAE
jgi:hypothetical protein